MITITSLHRYPVKGLRGIDVNSARVMSRGFEYDREWMLVDADNKFVTQRTANLMATISTQLTNTHLVLAHPTMPTLYIPLDHVDAEPENVVVWKDICTAVDQGSDSAEWLTKVLEPNNTGSVRLMRFALDGHRPVEPDFLADVSAETGFADGYPYLVANEASLEALNNKLDEPVPMNRFRPNIVVNGLPALIEHKLSVLDVPDRNVSMLLPKPCQRCKVTTINQDTGDVAESREPLRTLVKSNPFEDLVGGYFGQNGVAVEGLGNSLEVGDTAEVTYA
ncbi:MAG: MOSC domain-containing protein [Gammaproteobacteria bacterium]